MHARDHFNEYASNELYVISLADIASRSEIEFRSVDPSIHCSSSTTPEEEAAERRFVLKIDFLILPLLIIMFFLASLVRQSSLEAQNLPMW